MAKTSIIDPVSEYVPSSDGEVIFDSDLTGWVLDKVDTWEDARNSQHQDVAD